MRRVVQLFTMLFIFGLFLAVPIVAEAKSPNRSVCTDEGWEALKYVNEARVKRGLTPLAVSERMHYGTKLRAKELGTKFSHIRPNGNSYRSVYANRKYIKNPKESIVSGVTGELSAVKRMKRSSLDKSYMLSKNARHFSVAYKNGKAVATYSECGCVHTIKVKKSSKVNVPVGSSVEDLNLVLVVSCQHGKSYVPITKSMVSGYRKNVYGKQNVTIRWNGLKTVCKFNIEKRNLKDAKIVDAPSFVCLGDSPATIEGYYKVVYNGKTLKSGRDYTVRYENNNKVGEAKLVITGKGSYKGKLVYKFDCAKLDIVHKIYA